MYHVCTAGEFALCKRHPRYTQSLPSKQLHHELLPQIFGPCQSYHPGATPILIIIVTTTTIIKILEITTATTTRTPIVIFSLTYRWNVPLTKRLWPLGSFQWLFLLSYSICYSPARMCSRTVAGADGRWSTCHFRLGRPERSSFPPPS